MDHLDELSLESYMAQIIVECLVGCVQTMISPLAIEIDDIRACRQGHLEQV